MKGGLICQWVQMMSKHKDSKTVMRVEAKLKMHQGKSRADRRRIIEEFGGSGDMTLEGVAEYMRRSLSAEGET